MIASLLLSACLAAAPSVDQPPAANAGATTATAGQTTGAKAAQKVAPTPKAATKPAPAAAKPAPAAGGKPAAAPAAKAGAAAQEKGAAPSGPAPTGLLVIPTTRGKLEFSHKGHAKVACGDCHVGQAPPARIGVKDIDAAHKYCVDCHQARGQGPDKCTWCHTRP